MSDLALVQLDRAQHALAECKTAIEAKGIADAAEAARVYLERTNASVETVNRATEIRLLAERQMGEFLARMPKATGTKGQLVARGVIGGADEEPPINAPTLAEIGITKKQSATAQKLAAVPAEEFTARVAVAKAGGERLSTASVLSLPSRHARSPQQFSMDQWQRHARAQLGGLLNGVPSRHRGEAAAFVIELAKRFQPQEHNA